VIRAEGALVGAWRTMVEAVDVRTSVSEATAKCTSTGSYTWPQAAQSHALELAGADLPDTLAQLRSIAELERLPDYPTQFAFRTPGRSPPAHASPVERHLWELLRLEPLHLSSVVRSKSGLETLRRLADAGLATIAAFTPSDAMHVLGRQQGWVRESCAVRCPQSSRPKSATRGLHARRLRRRRSANARTSTWCAKAAVSCSAQRLRMIPESRRVPAAGRTR